MSLNKSVNKQVTSSGLLEDRFIREMETADMKKQASE